MFQQSMQWFGPTGPVKPSDVCKAGSFAVRAGNNLANVVKRFGDHIHFVHLRSAGRNRPGDFYKDDNCRGDCYVCSSKRAS